MKKIVLGITLLALCSALISCDFYGKEACAKCCKNVRKNLAKDAPKSLDEAIASYNWEVAHKYIGCYDNLTEETDRVAVKEKLLRAEVTYFLSQGEAVRAESVAKELGMRAQYQEILSEELPSLINNKRYDDAINILATWTFTEDFRALGKPFDSNSVRDKEEDNRAYNSEISSFNDLVDNLITRAILESDVDLAKKGLVLYVPNAVYSSTEKTGSDKQYKFVLKNTYKEAALKKLKEAGMRL